MGGLKAKRRELAMVHTKFDDLPVETETNDAHAKQLAKLEQSDIPDYRIKAERERKNWEHLFRTQILEKLHNALNEVVNLVTLLNTSLKKRPIGTNTYTLRYWLNRIINSTTICFKPAPSRVKMICFLPQPSRVSAMRLLIS